MDPVVICDTSPIRAFDHLDLLADLEKIAGNIIIPTAVETELGEPKNFCPPVSLAGFNFNISEPLTDLRENLKFFISDSLFLRSLKAAGER